MVLFPGRILRRRGHHVAVQAARRLKESGLRDFLFVFAGEDPVASAKALKDFAKANEVLEIKGGIMDGAAVSAAEVEAIASLPSREELYAHIAAAINGVAQGLATAIAGVPRGLAQVTKAVADQKEAA